MKKNVLLLLVVLVVALSLSACEKFNCKHDDPTQIELLESKTATCQESGLTEGLKCNICGVMVIPQAVVPSTECTDFINIPYKSPSCMSEGSYGGEMCKVCGKVVVQPTIKPKIDCRESDWIVDIPATISTDGARHTECEMCAKIMQQQIVAAGTQTLEYKQNTNSTYTVDDDGNQSYTQIVIPRMYNGRYVTSIGTHAFMGNIAKSITIPDTVKTIQNYAFSQCIKLENLVIPNSVQSFGDYCFKDCDSLQNIVIPDSVTSIGYAAFWGCESLNTVTIPKSITTLEGATFHKCTSLTTIIYEGTIEEWNNVKKSNGTFPWNYSTGEYTIYCSDGTIAKDGTTIYYDN